MDIFFTIQVWKFGNVHLKEIVTRDVDLEFIHTEIRVESAGVIVQRM